MTGRSVKSLDHPLVWWFCFAAGFAFVAAALPTDGSWDLKNYHIYNGFAVFHDRKALDIAPAQLQTTLYYGLDAAYYLIFSSLNDRPVLINLLLSIPYSAAALAIFLIARVFAKPRFLWPVLTSAAVTVSGLTGAATFATFATTLSELVPGLAVLIALAVWLTLEKAQRNTVWAALGVGGLAGVSVGLKLTQAPLFVGMALAIAARRASGQRSAFREALAFGLAGLIVFVALDGAWLWGNAKAYGNPIFPYMNNVFHSDLVASEPWADRRFLPKTTSMALLYPAYWAFRPSSAVSELSMRDPRILLGCVSALIIVLGVVLRRLRDRTALTIGSFESLGFSLAIVFLVSYALWEKTWSIYRYLAIQEALSGVLLLAALPIAFGARGKPWLMSGLFALIVVSTLRTTEYRGGAAPNVVRRLSRSNCRLSSRTRCFSSSILSLTPISYPRCRVRRARSASTTISFIPAVQGGSGGSSRVLFAITKGRCGASKIRPTRRAWPTSRWPAWGSLATVNARR